MLRVRWLSLVLLFAGVVGCQCGGPGSIPDAGSDGGPGDGGPPAPPDRCNIELGRFVSGQSGQALAKQIERTDELIGGPTAQGRVGDWLLQNEKIRVVVQGVDRHIGALPYGGTLLDADLVRADGGQDQLGEMGLLYNFGRTVDPGLFEVINDGADGQAAILAATGLDAPNDYLSLRNQLIDTFGNPPAADPYVAVPLKVTNYFILNPHEQRVRFVSALCNLGDQQTVLAVGDLVDPGYTLEFFNPQGCTGGFGYGGLCFGLDRMNWYGYHGTGVAYGVAPYQVEGPNQPSQANAALTVAGITGSVVGAPGLKGMLDWFDLSLTTRAGEMRIPAGGFGILSRDFWVGTDIGEIANLIAVSRSGVGVVTVTGQVLSGALPLAGARVAFESPDGNAVFTTGADGRFTAKVLAGSYQASAWAEGHLPTSKQTLAVVASAPPSPTFALTAPRRLAVTVREANGGPMPAKVTVLCAPGPCSQPQREQVLYRDTLKDPEPDAARLTGFVGASGTATFALPPAAYRVQITRGPEYSMFTAAVDLGASDGAVSAVLARVLDTTGYQSADLHVHAVNSPDSTVDNRTRAITFAADGIDVLVSTDHDYVTDFAPIIAQAGLTPFLTSVVGEEISTMDFGHYNFFPLPQDSADGLTSGAIDWAGGRGPTLTPRDLFAAGRLRGARTLQFNHPRGQLGGLTHLQVDLDTFATHADPQSFNMAVQPDATANDTRLLNEKFDSLEVFNASEDLLDGTSAVARARLNDWFTLISRGVMVAATGVSDTHTRAMATGWRTWVETGVDTPAQSSPELLSARLNAMRAVVSNGPFIKVSAYRVDGAGAQVTPSTGPGGTVAASTQDLGVTVEVQVPDYLDVTRVELYLHQRQDDARCPVDPLSAVAATTRVACHGVANTNWPSSSIAASQAVALTPADLRTVATDGALSFKRYQKSVSFRLPAPTTDNWVVAMVSGTTTLFPLTYPQPGLQGGIATTFPFAMSNPVLIDADGNGYDHPPFKPGQMKVGAVGPTTPPPAPTPKTRQQLLESWGRFVNTR